MMAILLCGLSYAMFRLLRNQGIFNLVSVIVVILSQIALDLVILVWVLKIPIGYWGVSVLPLYLLLIPISAFTVSREKLGHEKKS
jgi:hypothetical protein